MVQPTESVFICDEIAETINGITINKYRIILHYALLYATSKRTVFKNRLNLYLYWKKLFNIFSIKNITRESLKYMLKMWKAVNLYFIKINVSN